MRQCLSLLLCVALPSVLLIRVADSFAEDAFASTVTRLAGDLQYLSSDEQEGRDTGSEGIARAGRFIAERFEALGLNTNLFDGQAYQNFTIPGPPVLSGATHNLGGSARNSLRFEGELPPGFPRDLELGKDFTTLSLGSNGPFKGPLVFAGYGITAPDLEYDDYAEVDVRNKVVIVLRKEPQQNRDDSKFDGTRSSRFAYFSTKEENASLQGVAAMIIVNDHQSAGGERGDYLFEVEDGGKASTSNQVPTLFVKRAVLDPLLKAALGRNLDELEQAIDVDLQPMSRILPGFSASGQTETEASQVPARNVVACLPGAGSLLDQYVVVGAHFDHVGMGGIGSLAPGTRAIHNGADDNASGTAALLEIARRMTEEKSAERRSVVFIAFSAEEKGLLGSKHYVRNPRFPLENTVAMVNLDMVGRLSDNSLTVYGTGTSDKFDALVERLNQQTQFKLDKQPAGFGPSDHSSFYEVGIPVFHFFTGIHSDYHRPSDDFELLNLAGIARISNLVTELVRELTTQSDRPKLIKSAAVADVGQTFRDRPATPRAVFGIQMRQESEVAEVAAVMPNGPADQAGMRAGDAIIQVDESKVASFAELRSLMSRKEPGESVVVTVLRGADALQLTVTLGAE